MPSVRFVDAFCVTSMSSSIAICPIVLITAADSCWRRCCSCWEVVCICWRRDCSLALSSSIVFADSATLAWSSSIVGGVVMSMSVCYVSDSINVCHRSRYLQKSMYRLSDFSNSLVSMLQFSRPMRSMVSHLFNE